MTGRCMSNVVVLVCAAGFLLAGPAHGQSLNLDFHSGQGVPGEAFAAAAAQPGFWNRITKATEAQSLAGLDGHRVEAAVQFSGERPPHDRSQWGYADSEPGHLLNDGIASYDQLIVTFGGLRPGNYLLYTYACGKEPLSLNVPGSVEGTQAIVPGPWTGDFVLGQTHLVHHINTVDGKLTAVVAASQPNYKPAVAGMQLVAQPIVGPLYKAIQFDLGASAGGYAGAGPAHVAGDLAAGLTAWNTVSGDTAAGLVYGDGTAAEGVSIDFGSRGLGSTPYSEFAWDRPLSDLEGAVPQAFYQTGLLDDAIGLGDAYQNTIGARITGLAPGDYRVYVIPQQRYPDMRYDINVGVNGAGFDSEAAFETDLLVYHSEAYTAWIEGVNFIAVDVTIADEDDVLTIFSYCRAHSRQALSGIQIVPIPEPASALLIALGSAALARRRRRRAS